MPIFRSSKEKTIERWWEGLHQARSTILEDKRRIAALTKPTVLPPEEYDPDTDLLPELHTSIGPAGVGSLRGQLLTSVFPPEDPWFELVPAPDLAYGLEDTPENGKRYQEVADHLFRVSLMAQAVVESANLQQRRRTRRSRGFRSIKAAVMDQLITIGDTLEYLDENFRLHQYAFDQYVTQRDSDGGVLMHIIREMIDPLGLTDEQLAKADLKRGELREKNAPDRMMKLYTLVEWNPESRVWTVKQELNEKTISESDVGINSPYFSSVFELPAGSHYGYGYAENHKGDLHTSNELEMRILDHAGVASKLHPCIGIGSQVRADDLAQPSGTPIVNVRMVDGKPVDIGWFGADRIADFSVVKEVAERKLTSLGRAFLIGSELVRDSERTTGEEIRSVTIRELNGQLGGVYSEIAEDQQLPLIQRVIHQMRQKKMIPAALTDDLVDIRLLTGIAALSRETSLQRIRAFIQDIAQIPDAMREIKLDVLVDVAARRYSVHEPGLIKTQEEKEAEIRQALAVEGAQRGIDAAGTIAEQSARGAA